MLSETSVAVIRRLVTAGLSAARACNASRHSRASDFRAMRMGYLIILAGFWPSSRSCHKTWPIMSPDQSDLPVRECLPALRAALSAGRNAVLGGAPRCRQDHAGAIGAVGRVVGWGGADRDAGTAPSGGTGGGDADGDFDWGACGAERGVSHAAGLGGVRGDQNRGRYRGIIGQKAANRPRFGRNSPGDFRRNPRTRARTPISRWHFVSICNAICDRNCACWPCPPRPMVRGSDPC